MRKLLLAAAMIGGLSTLSAFGAVAAPSAAGLHVAPQPQATQVDYYWHRHHWHHRHWSHHRWHYWD